MLEGKASYTNYLGRVAGESSGLPHVVAHIVSTEDTSGWLLEALYKEKVIIYRCHYGPMFCIHKSKFSYVTASYTLHPMAAHFSWTHTSHMIAYTTCMPSDLE